MISGTGSLTKIGAGTLILTGDQHLYRRHHDHGRHLQIGNGGTHGLDRRRRRQQRRARASIAPTSAHLAGNISGTGRCRSRPGTLIFTGANTYTGGTTINAGTLQIGNGGTSGSITGNVSVNLASANLAFNRSDTISFGGTVSGIGRLTQAGTGTLVLTAANTYSGGTFVNSGILELNGSVASAVNVLAAGRLTGTGMVNGAVVNNGVIAPGSTANPLGTLVVTGNVTFNAGSFLQPTIVNTGGTSLLQAGSITISGGQVRPQTTAGSGAFLLQTDYRIALGTGGVAGTFTGVDTSLLPSGLNASLFYTATEAFLRVRRSASNFAATAGLSPNQSAVSASLDAALAANNPAVFTTYQGTYNTLFTASPGAAFQADLDTLSGDALTIFPIAAQGAAERFGDRLETNTWSNSSNLWGLIAYGDQNGDSDGNGPGYKSNGVEFQIGFATSLGEDTRVGVSVGMANDDVAADGRVASGNVDTWSVGAHLRHDFGGAYVAVQGTYSWHDIDTDRALLQGGTATGDFDAHSWTAAGEIGALFHTGRFNVEPFVSIRHASTHQKAYSESGPVGALDVAAAEYDTTRLGGGIRLIDRHPDSAVRPYVTVMYERELGDESAALDNDLPGLPTFRVVSTHLGQDVLTANLGLEARLGNGFSLFAGAGGRWRSNEHSLHANGGVRIVF